MVVEKKERTFIMVKPDGVQRQLIGTIISRFEQKGLKLVALKFLIPSKELLERHYAEHSSRPFFTGLVNFMHSGPVCAMVWEGKGSVVCGRTLLGATDPLNSGPGTVRGDFGLDIGRSVNFNFRNICHGSDSVQSAEREIATWFKDDEIMDYPLTINPWIHD
ncbi:Nucleoside diphosphate kinase [Thelohanellus kitauei]|uniref:Nucleoside diphosphate kinase n=1 Tax=Thelohanellus kitauei TaxID=669202 RepID=A0A0C2MFN0_THEKT|nr:Nucleoside diphosphate kinase [Thelohanellus kitauei]